MTIKLAVVNRENWREALQLAVHPEQQQFIADYTPIAAIALAKAYIRPGGLEWIPYAIYADEQMVGFMELAYEPGSTDQYCIYHFFIDYRQQNKGYGKAALATFIQHIHTDYPTCQRIRLTVHPENYVAQRLYISAGFRRTCEERYGEPEYVLDIVGK